MGAISTVDSYDDPKGSVDIEGERNQEVGLRVLDKSEKSRSQGQKVTESGLGRGELCAALRTAHALWGN